MSDKDATVFALHFLVFTKLINPRFHRSVCSAFRSATADDGRRVHTGCGWHPERELGWRVSVCSSVTLVLQLLFSLYCADDSLPESFMLMAE